MKRAQRYLVILAFGILKLPYRLMAQGEGMLVDDLSVQDSALMEQEFMVDAVMKSSGQGNTWIVIAAVLVVTAVLACFILKKKRISP